MFSLFSGYRHLEDTKREKVLGTKYQTNVLGSKSNCGLGTAYGVTDEIGYRLQELKKMNELIIVFAQILSIL